MDLLNILIALAAGLVLLLVGRRFFWLAAGLVGFLFGFALTEKIFGAGFFSLLVGIVIGLVLGWLATKFIKIVAYILGIIAGATALPIALSWFGVAWNWWLTALIGGIIGLLLVVFAFDWGLILLTAWVGASVVAENIGRLVSISSTISGLIFIALFILGVIFQASQRRKKR